MPLRDDKPMILTKKHKLPHELYTRRNTRNSPSWSFRCDNRTHIEDIGNSSASNSHGRGVEIEWLSDGSSSPGISQWRKFPNESSIPGSTVTGNLDRPIARSPPREVKEISESSSTAISSDPKPYSTDQASSSRVYSPPSDPTSSWKPHPFPVPPLDSLSEEGGPSFKLNPFFKLSFSSNDMTAEESHGGSSDGWSVCSYAEFMLTPTPDSSQRDIMNTQLSSSSASFSDLQTCGLCLKLLKERASWKGNEISIAAVLVCGHVYHAECLETVTAKALKFDPSCPVCTHGESSIGKALSKTRNKISRRAVASIDVGGNFTPEFQKSGSCILKDARLAASTSAKSSFGRSFLRRHFSMGSRSTKLLPETESRRKKGFWARYR